MSRTGSPALDSGRPVWPIFTCRCPYPRAFAVLPPTPIATTPRQLCPMTALCVAHIAGKNVLGVMRPYT